MNHTARYLVRWLNDECDEWFGGNEFAGPGEAPVPRLIAKPIIYRLPPALSESGATKAEADGRQKKWTANDWRRLRPTVTSCLTFRGPLMFSSCTSAVDRSGLKVTWGKEGRTLSKWTLNYCILLCTLYLYIVQLPVELHSEFHCSERFNDKKARVSNSSRSVYLACERYKVTATAGPPALHSMCTANSSNAKILCR